jgi:MFS family permease
MTKMQDKTIKKRQTGLILAGLMLSLLPAALDSTIVGTAMKRIIEDLNGLQLYAWPFTIYMLCSTVAIPISGGLADMYGRKPVFITGIAIFLLGSALCGLSVDMTQLIVFRGLQGIGGGMLFSLVFTSIGDIFPPAERARWQGLFSGVFGLASVFGPTAGGYITDTWGWEIPAGKIEAGESPIEGAEREALEETGWQPGPLRHVTTFHPVNGMGDHTFHIFLTGSATYIGEPTDRSEAGPPLPYTSFSDESSMSTLIDFTFVSVTAGQDSVRLVGALTCPCVTEPVAGTWVGAAAFPLKV